MKVIIILLLFFFVSCKPTSNSDDKYKIDPDFDIDTLGIEWIDIPAGEFPMGANANEGSNDEQPVHTVYLDAYKISKYEVTFRMYDKYCEMSYAARPDDKGWGRKNRPVINVTLENAKAFCAWLSKKTGKNIYLPTEAQWEKAARGTGKRRYPWGNSTPTCAEANYFGCGDKTKEAGSHPSGISAYGVHDMAGNVWEWCADIYSARYYSNSPRNNPTGAHSGSGCVARGGGWFSDVRNIRSTTRFRLNPAYKASNLGFRICRD